MIDPSVFSITVLGNSAAIPTKNTHLSSQVIVNKGKYFLVDCGEGTLLQLIKYGIKYSKIDNIFISHLHGDHFFGLIGLISTFHLLGREKELNIYAPAELESIIRDQLRVAHTILKYKLIFRSLNNNGINQIFESNDTIVYSFPLVHRVPTWGFKFIQKPKSPNIKKSFIEEFSPSINEIINIKNGRDFKKKDGNIIENSEITNPAPKQLSYAYCSDTKYDSSFIAYIKNVTLLFHEATFDNSMQDIATEKYHSTARDAATIAKKANVSGLLLGHFSARHKDYDILKREASEVFNPTIISREGENYIIQ